MKKWWIWLFAACAIMIGVYIGGALTRPLAVNVPQIDFAKQSTAATDFSWPTNGRAAVGFLDSGASNCRVYGDAGEFPTASLAKVITTQVVLSKYPLTGNSDGPTLTMTDADVALLNATEAENGSFVPIVAGEQLTERQMLQAILLESANNLANSLAIWAFGSLDNYRAAAQDWLAKNGLTNITVGSDASGFDPSTKASAGDLCKLMLIASENSALVGVMGTQTVANFPVANTLTNTNQLLGQDGVFAGKTGFTGDAGHGVLILAHVTVGGAEQTVAIAMLGQDSYDAAFAGAQTLLDSVAKNLTIREIAKKGQTIGQVTSPWGAKTDLVAQNDMKIMTWLDQTADVTPINLSRGRASLASGEATSTLDFANQSVRVVAKNNLAKPSWWWRILHGFDFAKIHL